MAARHYVAFICCCMMTAYMVQGAGELFAWCKMLQINEGPVATTMDISAIKCAEQCVAFNRNSGKQCQAFLFYYQGIFQLSQHLSWFYLTQCTTPLFVYTSMEAGGFLRNTYLLWCISDIQKTIGECGLVTDYKLTLPNGLQPPNVKVRFLRTHCPI